MSTLLSQLVFCPLTDTPTKKSLLAFQKDAGWSISMKDVESILNTNKRIQWVSVELDKVKIGIARLELAPPEFCFVSDLVIKSKYRRQGVGRWLLRHVEDMCNALAIRRVLLTPEPRSMAFYESLSFVSDPFVPGVLRKDLNPFQRKVFLAR
jgi:GNAT superfamily N-acetyltransferase